jgi:ABC-type multidrug transport system permease subunit
MGLAGCFFFMALNIATVNMMGTILTFQNERPVFLRELANKMYSVPAYYFAKLMVDIPVLCVGPMVFSLIVYFKIGVVFNAAAFFVFYLVMLLIAYSSSSFGYLLSCMFTNGELAVGLAPLI